MIEHWHDFRLLLALARGVDAKPRGQRHSKVSERTVGRRTSARLKARFVSSVSVSSQRAFAISDTRSWRPWLALPLRFVGDATPGLAFLEPSPVCLRMRADSCAISRVRAVAEFVLAALEGEPVMLAPGRLRPGGMRGRDGRSPPESAS